MPIYEFNCSCGCSTEKIVSLGTKTVKCESCGKEMEKFVSRSSFILKGSGWSFDNYGAKEINKKK